MHGQSRQHNDSDIDRFNVPVVGESHYQNHFERLCGERSFEGVNMVMVADVIPDSSNKFDHEAVRVDINGLTVGYLPREAAPVWREQFGDRPIQCDALIRGGWYRSPDDEGMFGVRLCATRGEGAGEARGWVVGEPSPTGVAWRGWFWIAATIAVLWYLIRS